MTPSSASASSSRHYYRYSSTYTPTKVNETKRNKRVINDESIWEKIEQDFTPELLQEQLASEYNIPETVRHSPKQQSSSLACGGDGAGNGDGDDDGASSSVHAAAPAAAKKMSALFVKPDINMECLYRKSGIRENCEV